MGAQSTKVAMSGGLSRDSGIIRAMEAKLGTPVLLPDEPQMVGALGAILFAFDRASKLSLAPVSEMINLIQQEKAEAAEVNRGVSMIWHGNGTWNQGFRHSALSAVSCSTAGPVN